jgi:hypothetical protein
MNDERPTALPPEIAAKLEKRKRFPRARRWLFNFAAALSLLLFVGNYWLWWRGVDAIMDVWISPRIANRQLTIQSFGGQTNFAMRKWESPDKYRSGYYADNLNPEQGYNTDGLQWYSTKPPPLGWFEISSRMNASPTNLSIPKWFLQLLFAILPLWWLGRFALRWSEKRERMKAEG